MARDPVTANELLIGAHQSIAGGTPRAVERGVGTGCRVLQIFVKNNSRWVGKTIGMTDPRLAQIPKFLETPKDDSLDFDRKNLATLRRLAVARPRRRER